MNDKEYIELLRNIAYAAKELKHVWNSTMDDSPKNPILRKLFWAVLELEDWEKGKRG